MFPSDYQEAVNYLFSRRARGMKLGLDNIRELASLLGNPQEDIAAVHIAGTNGKGSTAALLQSILNAAGYRAGLYTSPHLQDMRERIRIKNSNISEAEVLVFMKKILPLAEETGVSFFEILTMLAFMHFREAGIDMAVLETGLGGRLDATSICRPVITLITDIHLDHTRILGKRLTDIAAEKAGILKAGIPCICSVRYKHVREKLSELAEQKKAPLRFASDLMRQGRIRLSEHGSHFDLRTEHREYRDLFVGLCGRHQIRNTVLAVLAAETLNTMGWPLSEHHIRAGLKAVHWPARLQLLQTKPKVLLDSAHNPEGIRMLVKSLKRIFAYKRLILVFGVLEDKHFQKMAALIAPVANTIIFTTPLSDRALDPAVLSELPDFAGIETRVIPSIKSAVSAALRSADPEDLICCAGSIFLVGEILTVWDQIRHKQETPKR